MVPDLRQLLHGTKLWRTITDRSKVRIQHARMTKSHGIRYGFIRRVSHSNLIHEHCEFRKHKSVAFSACSMHDIYSSILEKLKTETSETTDTFYLCVRNKLLDHSLIKNHQHILIATLTAPSFIIYPAPDIF